MRCGAYAGRFGSFEASVEILALAARLDTLVRAVETELDEILVEGRVA
jgi:hypothetical protein